MRFFMACMPSINLFFVQRVIAQIPSCENKIWESVTPESYSQVVEERVKYGQEIVVSLIRQLNLSSFHFTFFQNACLEAY